MKPQSEVALVPPRRMQNPPAKGLLIVCSTLESPAKPGPVRPAFVAGLSEIPRLRRSHQGSTPQKRPRRGGTSVGESTLSVVPASAGPLSGGAPAERSLSRDALRPTAEATFRKSDVTSSKERDVRPPRVDFRLHREILLLPIRVPPRFLRKYTLRPPPKDRMHAREMAFPSPGLQSKSGIVSCSISCG
jgi:hypothetical protein